MVNSGFWIAPLRDYMCKDTDLLLYNSYVAAKCLKKMRGKDLRGVFCGGDSEKVNGGCPEGAAAIGLN